MTTSPQTPETLTPISDAEERRTLGFARVRGEIFDAVYALWEQREAEGVKKKDLALSIGYHPSQITRALAGPGNWTLETVGALVEALDGRMSVRVDPIETCVNITNYNIYDDIIDGVRHRYCPVTSYQSGSVDQRGVISSIKQFSASSETYDSVTAAKDGLFSAPTIHREGF